MKTTKLVAALVLVVLSLIVVLQNTAPMETKFLFVTVTMPRAALLGITLLAGIAVGILIALAVSVKKPKKTERF